MAKKRRSLAGSLLIAPPRLSDKNFFRTVVLVVQHDEQGAFGLVLNRVTELPVADLWKAIQSGEGPATSDLGFARQGGPVEQQAILVLHGFADLAPDQEPVIPGVYLTTDVESLARLVERADQEPDPALRIFCGYAGWAGGQLDAEMAAGGWLVAPAEAGHVFVSEPDALWAETIGSLGGIYRLLALMPPHPERN